MGVGSRGVRVVEKEEFDIAAGEEAGDVVVVEAVDVLQVPERVSQYGRLSCSSISTAYSEK